MEDGSRPSVAGLQEQATNHRKRHCLKDIVVSITEKAHNIKASDGDQKDEQP